MSDLPKTMKAVQLIKQGPPAESLVLNENADIPTMTSPSQVLIKVKAAGVETAMALIASGLINLPSFALKFPTTIGLEYSGVVAKVGDKVEGYAVGDEVFGVKKSPFGPHGTTAEYIVIDTLTEGIVKKPKHISFEQASVMGTALAAYKGMICMTGYDINDKTVKRKLLIIGASGGVGGYGVQISKIIGAETVGICSGRNAEYVKQLGADRIVDYTDPNNIDELVNNEAGSYDLIFDTIGGDDYYFKLKGLLKNKTGIYSTAVGPFSILRSKGTNIFGLIGSIAKGLYRSYISSEPYVFYFGSIQIDKLPVVANWLETKELVSLLRDDSNVFRLEDTAELYDLLLNKKPVGRYAVRMN